MSIVQAEVAITPWCSLEAECLRLLLESQGMSCVRTVGENTRAYVLLMSRKSSPWPLALPTEAAGGRLPVMLLVDSVVPWTIALGRSLRAATVVSWHGSGQTITTALGAVLSGVPVPFVTGELLVGDPMAQLTRREREVMTLVARGDHDYGIADTLDISVSTVRTHVHNALAKLNVTHRHAAATLVRRSSLMAFDRSIHVPSPRRGVG